ncbi:MULTISPECIES: ASCH domain-containing protein [Clostridium]|uniref:Morphogenetic protein n=1 Tax=Clostridium frigoriphilum TaxID=443253 RepID=A0ABU7UHK1_9CLOT|nr:hypothetical protein [Clostridium sp. DSM 17811]MBU3098363.1 hypothetical protein [Clostridium sp. DSM 17811]
MERPILFNTAMVQAIIEDRKVSTRRPVKRTPSNDDPSGYGFWKEYSERDKRWYVKDYTHSPIWWTLREYISKFSKYHIGDTIWVRETWTNLQALDDNENFIDGTERYYYRAGDCPEFTYYLNDDGTYRDSPKWSPSIHMPRKAARIFLNITDVRIERLKNITEPEALKEGFVSSVISNAKGDDYTGFYAHEHFIDTWDKTYAKKGNGWDDNPWVWVIEFEAGDINEK